MDVHEIKLLVARDDYDIDPHRVAEALLDRLSGFPDVRRDERVIRRGARGPAGPAPLGPRHPSA